MRVNHNGKRYYIRASPVVRDDKDGAPPPPCTRRKPTNRGGARGRLNLATWIVGTLTGKAAELTSALPTRKVDIACPQETRWKGEKSCQIRHGYKLPYFGEVSGRNGVGIAINEEPSNEVPDMVRRTDRLIAVGMVWGKSIVNIVSAYAPQVGSKEDGKELPWDELKQFAKRIPADRHAFIAGDLHGHAGRARDGYGNAHGGYGYGNMNPEGRSILEFAQSEGMAIVNTWPKKRGQHLTLYSSGGKATQIDYMLTRRCNLVQVKDCKTLPSESHNTQRRPLVMDIKLKNPKVPVARVKDKRPKC